MKACSFLLAISLALAAPLVGGAQDAPPETVEVMAATTSVVPVLATIDGVVYRGEAFPVVPGAKVTLMPNRESPVFKAIAAHPFEATGDPLEVAEPTRLSVQLQSRTEWHIPEGKVSRISEHDLEWIAPLKPGNYNIGLTVSRKEACLDAAARQERAFGPARQNGAAAAFTMLTMSPYDRDGDGMINGRPVGIYPDEDAGSVSSYVAPRRELYRPPKWFIQLTPDVAKSRVSTHFKLGDFAPDSDLTQGDAYIAINYQLVDRLEELIKELHQVGHAVRTLKIHRGYVTPNQLNQLKRKGSKMAGFTRHLYGDAAVVYVDMDDDGQMDDLNRDGKVDLEDAEYLGVINDKIERRTQKFGGLGVFAGGGDPTSPQTPYIELDMRGSRARW